MKSMVKVLGTVSLIMFFALTSCEKDNKDDSVKNCNVSNPAEELDWLKAAIEDVKQDEYAFYVMANYKGKTVFYYGNCHPAVDYAAIVKNCNGDSLGYTYDLDDELSDIEILWKHTDSKCNLQE